MYVHPHIAAELIRDRQRELPAAARRQRNQRDCQPPRTPGPAAGILLGFATAIARAVARSREAGATAEILATAQQIARP